MADKSQLRPSFGKMSLQHFEPGQVDQSELAFAFIACDFGGISPGFQGLLEGNWIERVESLGEIGSEEKIRGLEPNRIAVKPKGFRINLLFA